MGTRAVIAPSFSDIFAGNAFKNGIAAIELPQAAVDRLLEVARDHPIAVDIDNETVTTPYQDRFAFSMDPFRRRCLLDGIDEIGLTLASAGAIDKYENSRAAHMPWIEPRGRAA